MYWCRCFGAKRFRSKQNKITVMPLISMRTERLELSHLAILEPKSSASTNSATSACKSWTKALVLIAVVNCSTDLEFGSSFCLIFGNIFNVCGKYLGSGVVFSLALPLRISLGDWSGALWIIFSQMGHSPIHWFFDPDFLILVLVKVRWG